MTAKASLRTVQRPVEPLLPAKTFAEFFAGIGLVYAGLKESGWQCAYANDNDARKRKLYEAIHGPSPHFHLQDVAKTEEVLSRIPNSPFLATASFPCIDMSLAGHYRGFNGRHSSVFFNFVEVLEALGNRRPQAVMLENVTGFITAHNGADFATAARSLVKLGYSLDAFILNAKQFTPQSRPRVFVIGICPELVPSREPSLWECALDCDTLRPKKLLDVMRRTRLPTDWLQLALPEPPKCNHRLVDLIDFGDEQEWWDESEVKRHYAMMFERHRRQVDKMLVSGGRHVATAFRRIRQGAQRAEARFDGLAGCLRTPRGGSAKQIVIAMDQGRLRMRWMSPQEYARLQGLKQIPSVSATRNELLLAFGDAVCVPVVQWIDVNILTPLFETFCAKSRNGRARQPNTRTTSQDNGRRERERHFP